MIAKLLKNLAPVAALAFGTLVAGCDGRFDMKFGETDGVPLAELDMSGGAPTEIVVAGPDSVIVSNGSRLNIDVSGDPQVLEALRFSLTEGTLGISRTRTGSDLTGTAVVRVTMPDPRAIVLAGSGTLQANALAADAEVTIAGSGKARVAEFSGEKLNLTIAGSGDFEAAGTAKELDLTVAGSGAAQMASLRVDEANVTIAGSGNATFASDGQVEASIMGSGVVTVLGRATCTVSAMGSGTLNCRETPATGQSITGATAPRAEQTTSTPSDTPTAE